MLVSDAGELSPTRFAADGVVDLPTVDHPDYPDAVVAACRDNAIAALLPATDLDPVILATLTPRLAEFGATVFLPAPEVALGCQDKWECHLMLERAGLPSPPRSSVAWRVRSGSRGRSSATGSGRGTSTS